MTEFEKKSFSVFMGPRPEYGSCPRCGNPERIQVVNKGMTDQVFCADCGTVARKKKHYDKS